MLNHAMPFKVVLVLNKMFYAYSLTLRGERRSSKYQFNSFFTHPLVPVTIRLRQETALKSKIKKIIYLLDVDPCLVNLGNWNLLYNNISTEISRHSFLMKTIIIDGYHFKLTLVDI
jgi:hypothetical protein